MRLRIVCSLLCQPSFFLVLISPICYLLVQLLTTISTIDDLNYPEKTKTYYIVNAPYMFSACWKVFIFLSSLFLSSNSCKNRSLMLFCKYWQTVKPLLQERTKRKIQVLQGSGKDELLKVRKPLLAKTFCSFLLSFEYI